MPRKYTTTVSTEWDIVGDVTPEMINERLKLALNIVMMTVGASASSGNYAFTGSKHLLKISTKEAKSNA